MNDDILLISLREQISSLDLKIISLLAERRLLARKIGLNKIDQVKPIRDKNREHNLLKFLIKEGKKLELDSFYINKLFRIIIEDSVLIQQSLVHVNLNNLYESSSKFSFLGKKGSYSYIAALLYSKRYNINMIEYGCKNFSDIIDSLEKEQSDYSVLPIENSNSGAINEVYDLLKNTKLFLIGEIYVNIDHSILTISTSNIDQIETIYSHEQPFKQCSNFLTNFPKWKFEYCNSTSEAMEKVSKINSSTVAALGSNFSGKLYGLHTLKTNISNYKKNITRFAILSKKQMKVSYIISAKTMLAITIKKRSNTLIKILSILDSNHIIVDILTSRPEYDKNIQTDVFFINVLENLHSLKMQNFLQELYKITLSFKILGCYPNNEILMN